MELAIECGACAAIQLSRTLSARSRDDWQPAYSLAFGAIAASLDRRAEPAEVLSALYGSVAASLQDDDFYQAAKDTANASAEAWFSQQGPPLADLESRILLAAAANAIDAGVDVEPAVVFAHFEQAAADPPGRDDRAEFLKFYESLTAPRVLYLLDNAGEAVFDREVMRALQHRGADITAVVRQEAVLNDVTAREAECLALHEVASVTTTRSPGYGLAAFADSAWSTSLFGAAHLVIAKGIANLETLSHRRLPCPILFLYRAKCEPSARAGQAARGSTVIWWRPAS